MLLFVCFTYKLDEEGFTQREKKGNLEKLQLPLLLIHGKLGGIALLAKQREGLGCGSIKWHTDWKLAASPQSFSFQAEQVHPWEELSCSLHGTLDSAGTCRGSLPAGPSPLAPWLCKDPNQGHSPWLVKRNIPCFPEQSCAG